MNQPKRTIDLTLPVYLLEGKRLADPSPLYLAGSDEHPYWTHDAEKARWMVDCQHAVDVKNLMYHHIKATKVEPSELKFAISSDSLQIVSWFRV